MSIFMFQFPLKQIVSFVIKKLWLFIKWFVIKKVMAIFIMAI